jgi:hypothetical protein
VIEVDRIFVLLDEIFVDDIEHFQEGHIAADVPGGIGLQLSGTLGILLSPNV